MTSRTRIKFCGFTRSADIKTACDLGVDAIGLVFYPPSPRCVSPDQAKGLCRMVVPFVSTVGLFVNPSDEWFDTVLNTVPLSVLQFHGDETPARCQELALRAQLPFIKAARVHPQLDLLHFADNFSAAQALLLDAFVDGYGGGGAAFDWTLLPSSWLNGNAPPLVLSGGLNAQNVAEGIRCLQPVAVDVSSGIEISAHKGFKNAEKMLAFIQAVDTTNNR